MSLGQLAKAHYISLTSAGRVLKQAETVCPQKPPGSVTASA